MSDRHPPEQPLPIAGVELHRLAPDRLDDFMAFFEGEAFEDNPDWSSCYCQCYYEDHRIVRWTDRTGMQNRRCASDRIVTGSMQGVLAYRDGRVVGWCNAAPRKLLHALDGEPVDDVERIGTILCFVVAPRLRGQGVAKALLAAACHHLRDQGMAVAEANPRAHAAGPADQHFGPLRLYLEAGFEAFVHPGRDAESDGSVWVKKTL